MTTSTRSLAGHVLSTGTATPEEARQLAASVLGDEPPVRTVRTKRDLQRLLTKIEGTEGQTERAALIRRQIEEMT